MELRALGKLGDAKIAYQELGEESAICRRLITSRPVFPRAGIDVALVYSSTRTMSAALS